MAIFLSSGIRFLAGSHPIVLNEFCLKYFNKVPSLAPISKTTSPFFNLASLVPLEKYFLVRFSLFL